MSQTGQLDLEGGGNHGPESGCGDSSWPLYSMYSKIADDDDDKVVESFQKEIDGTLIFAGLFSATVGALLTLTIPDLKPNSQDTSAFYLEKMYQLFGNSTVSQPSIPSALANPPAFSPPIHAIWVNSLWSLSLAISLTTAVAAIIKQNTLVNSVSISRRPSDTPAKRARIRAIIDEGIALFRREGSGNFFYLQYSFILFIIGALIYTININRAVFYAVVWWVGLMAIVYAQATSAVFLESKYLLYTPFSLLALRIYLGISYAMFQIRSHISSLYGPHNNTRWRHRDLSSRYRDGIWIGKWREFTEIASKPSPEIDSTILRRILLSLDDDHALEAFFDAIPGFCNSELCVLPLSAQVQSELRQALDGLLDHTFSSSSISESVRIGRLITCLDAAHAALGPSTVSGILDKISNGHWDEVLQSVEMGHGLRLWSHSRDYDLNIRQIVACIIARVRERDDRWTLLVKETFGVPDHVFRDYLAHGDSALLSILIHVSRQANRAGPFPFEILSSLSKFDIRNTLPRLQHDFCTLWNEIAQEARNQGLFRTPGKILSEIHHLYIALHQNNHATPTPSTSDSLNQSTHATPAPFSISTDRLGLFILDQPWSYSPCNITSHRSGHDPVAISDTVSIPVQPGDPPDAPPHRSTLHYNTTLRLAEETSTITGLPSPPGQLTPSEFGETSHAFTSTFPIHFSSPPSDLSPRGDVATAQPDTTAGKLSYPLESGRQEGQATPPAAPLADNSGTLPTFPMPVPILPSTLTVPMPVPLLPSTPTVSMPVPLLASNPTVPNKISTTYGTSPAFITESSLPASSGGFPAPDTLSPPPVPPLLNAELLSQRSGMSPKDPSDNATPLCLHPRRLADNGDMCLANAVLQLLVYCPPFQDLIRDLGRFVDQRGGGESGADATPLMDASVRFMDKFPYKEKSSVAHQFQQQVGGSKVKEDEDGEKEDGVHLLLLTDVYDAMKEKRQFDITKDGQQQDAAVFLGLYLEALDEELVKLRSSISTHKPDSTLKVEKLEEQTQLGEGQTEVREQGYKASSVDSGSAISRIFDGRSRSTIRAPNQHDIVTVEDWRSLKLNIRPNSVHTIQDALTHISQPQAIPVEAGQYSSSEARQQAQIEALPPILVLHLERFLYDAASDGIIKMSKPVQFAPELEIPLETMASVPGKSAELVKYELCGALYHPGESADSGHYVVEVLHPIGDRGGGEAWLHIDDEAVSMVQHEDVFWGYANEPGNDRCAYMLFYCRKASART